MIFIMLHMYMNKYYSTILKIQDYQHEQEQKEYQIPSEPPKDLEKKLSLYIAVRLYFCYLIAKGGGLEID
jgi:hypothetical protein